MAPKRRNGFSRPFATLQMGTWVALPLVMLQFLVFVSPILPVAASIPCTLLFFGLVCTSAYYAYQACVTDPMDVHLSKHLNDARTNGGSSTSINSTIIPSGNSWWYKNPSYAQGQSIPDKNSEPTKYCWVCETDVAEHSMHCKYCNKCVAHFDHHCQWLNTCVGQANYPFFYMTLWSISIMLLVHIVIMLGLVISIFVDQETEQRANDWFHANLSGFVAGVLIFTIVFDVTCVSLVGQLLMFHIGLQKEGITTYQYILRDTQRRRDRAKLRHDRQAQRMVAAAQAKEQGKGCCLAWRLQLGDKCNGTACDPLPLDEEQPQQVQESVQSSASAPTLSPSPSLPSSANGHHMALSVEAITDESKEEEEDVADENGTTVSSSQGSGVIWQKV